MTDTAPPRWTAYEPVRSLLPALKNPKAHDQEAMGASAREFGFMEPVVVDERTGRLVSGHGRVEWLAEHEAAGADVPEGVVVDALPPRRSTAAEFVADLDAAESRLEQASTNPVERVKLARAEHLQLQQWIKDGENPPKPHTPNLDALNAEHSAGRPNSPKVRKAANNPRTAPVGAYAEALAAKKAAKNKRGPGGKATAEDLAKLAGELRAKGLTEGQGLEVAYWLCKLAVSRGTWAKAWAATAA